MDLHRTILIQRIILVLGFIAVMFITLCYYKQEVEILALIKQKESLEGLVEMQKSAIADFEVNCKDLYEENLKLKFGEK